MLKFTYKQLIRERVQGKCTRHPRYNPEKDGRAGVKGGCATCHDLYDLHAARLRPDAAVLEFLRRAGPWARHRERHRTKRTIGKDEPDQALQASQATATSLPSP